MNILIVEDDRVISLMLTKIVTNLNHTVVEKTPAGETAVDLVEEKSVDLILMDIMLEGYLDGIEATERIQTKHNIPVIYITGNSDPQTIERAQKTYHLAYLNKPVDFQSIKKIFKEFEQDGGR